MAEDGKKRKGRRAYLEDFQKTASGEYVYTGSHYAYVEQGMTFRRSMAVRWLLGGGTAALALLGGCIPVPGMTGGFFVLMPYIAAVLSAVSVLWAVARLAYWGSPLREYVYQKTVAALPGRCVLVAVFAALTLAGEAAYLPLKGTDGVATAFIVLFFVSQAGALGCALGLRRFERLQKWSK